MLSIISAIMLAAFAFVFTATPKYKATAKVLIGGPTTSYRDPDLGGSIRRQQGSDVQREVYSQVEVIQSRDLAKRVAASLKLDQRREFQSSAKTSFIKGLLISLGFKSNPNAQREEQRITNKIASNLTVFPILRSKVIQIEYNSTDPVTSADVANALSKSYLQWTKEIQLADTRGANDWLTGQIDTLRDDVRRKEAEIELFRAQNGLIQGATSTSTLARDELSELNRQIALAAAARAEAEAKAFSIRKMMKERGSVAASNDVINSNLIQRLREQEIALGRRLAELNTTYLSSHPRIVSARREIQDVRREIRREALKIVQGLEQQAKVALAREASLRASLNELKTTASGNKQKEVELRALEREAKAYRDQLELLLKRNRNASARQDIRGQSASARIILHATVPSSPAFPKKGPILIVAMGAAMAIALLAAFLVEAIAGTARPAAVRPQQPKMWPEELRGAEAQVSAQSAEKLEREEALAAARLAVRAQSLTGTSPTPASDPCQLASTTMMPQAGQQDQIQASAQAPVAAPVQAPAHEFANTLAELSSTPTAATSQYAPPSVDAPLVLPAAAAASQQPETAVAQMPEPVTEPAPVAQMPLVQPGADQETPVIANILDVSGDVAGLTYKVVGDPGSPFATSISEAAKSVAGKLGHLPNIKLFVAPTHNPSSGAIFSAGLARSFAEFGLKTIVIDATMGGRDLVTAFGIEAGVGLAEFLKGDATFSDAIVRDGASSAHVMTGGTASQDAIQFASNDRIQVTLQALGQAYDIVIISAANVVGNPWSIAFAGQSDLALLVARADVSDGVVNDAAEMLKSSITTEVGLVMAHGPQQEISNVA